MGPDTGDGVQADADTFGGTGLLSHFRGPYADGPPEKALHVKAPRIHRFGLHEIRRMVVITFTLAFLIGRSLALRVVRAGGRTGSWASAASMGVVDAFEALGPTFVKLGQMIASSPGIFPEPLADACLRCLDEVTPFDGPTARRLVEEDLGHSPAALFRHYDDSPLSAASIAQVHACTLPDGREAVLKIQRPDIRHRMNRDLRIMYLFARPLMRTDAGQRANVTGILEDLHQVTNEELNFAVEAYRQSRFRDNIGAFGDNRFITAPEVYWDYCGPHVICMERMVGAPLDEFERLRAMGIDGEMVLRRGVKVWMEAAMIHGPFHGDVHAGNLWLLDDGRASYLDFGIMGELDAEWMQILRDMQFTAMIDGDWTRIVRNWKRVGVMSEDAGTDEDLALMIKAVMDPLLDQSIGEVSLGELMQQNLELGKQLGIKTPRELVLITKQLLYFERYAKELAHGYNMSRDLFLLKNIFPDDVARVAAERNLTLPE
jgi:predicted unusual protein kinase regulating ubiquinone biosynthesis (AarF/ABC1/UbiB family)